MEHVKILLMLVFAVAGMSVAQASTLYKWVDEQGKVSYHDRPPPEGSDYKVERKDLGSGGRAEVDSGLEKIVEKFPVVLYSVPVCGSCDLARHYLQKRKVPYSEQNLENNPELQQKLKKQVGSISAPTITIGEKVMKGYVESILEGELDTAGYPKIASNTSPEGEKKESETESEDPGNQRSRTRY